MPQSPQYPLQMTFKLLAMAPQIFVKDAQGQPVAYVRQKLFKLKEAITVFSDDSQTETRFHIHADRVIDFSARYNFSDSQGAALGAVKQRGMRSLWRAGFDVLDKDVKIFSIDEKSVLTRFFDNLFNQLPLIGLLSGYIFQPAYEVTRPDGSAVMRLKKQPALLEGRFGVEKLAAINPHEEQQLLLSFMMLLLLERNRG